MKVAICVSGLARCAIQTFDNLIKNIAYPLNADVFIHTWDIDDDKKKFGDCVDKIPTLKSNKEIFFTQYNCVKKILVEQQDSQWNIGNVSQVANIVPMYYSIYAANKLRQDYELQEGIKYDIVVRSRFDSLYTAALVDEELNYATNNKNIIFVGLNAYNKGGYESRRSFISESTGQPFVADNFAFGSSTVMDIYSNTYIQLNDLFNYTHNPETCLGIHLKNKNIEPLWTNFRYMSLVKWEQNNIIFESDYEEKQYIYFA